MNFALGLLIGAVLGIVIALAFHFRRIAATTAASRTAEARLVDLQTEHARANESLDAARGELRESELARAGAEARVRNDDDRDRQRKADQDSLRVSMEELMDRGRTELSRVADPLRETLTKYENELHQMETVREGAYRELRTTVEELRKGNEHLVRETNALVTALRSPQTRGRWGEVQLRNVVELAGMLEHCDFEEQRTIEGGARPDMIIHVPGGGKIAVDAKVPLDAYLRFIDASDDESRKLALQAHAKQVRAHVVEMSKRAYWKNLEGSAEFAVVFIPGEPLLSAAFEHDPTLLEDAMKSDILITTPVTLIALLRAAAFGWRQERFTIEAKQVQLLGAQLYERLTTMWEHMGKLGRYVNQTVDSFNSMVGSFERRVLPAARKFPELGIEVKSEIGELAAVEGRARTDGELGSGDPVLPAPAPPPTPAPGPGSGDPVLPAPAPRS